MRVSSSKNGHHHASQHLSVMHMHGTLIVSVCDYQAYRSMSAGSSQQESGLCRHPCACIIKRDALAELQSSATSPKQCDCSVLQHQAYRSMSAGLSQQESDV